MFKRRILCILAVVAMLTLSFGAQALAASITMPTNGSVNLTKTDFPAPSTDPYGVAQKGFTKTEKKTGSGDVSILAYITTVDWYKEYENGFGWVVARHDAYTQWMWEDGNILAAMDLWQDHWVAPLYGFKDPGQQWNYVYSNVAEANHWVTFESGIPSPWGHIGGSSFTSRIITQVNGWGESQAY